MDPPNSSLARVLQSLLFIKPQVPSLSSERIHIVLQTLECRFFDDKCGKVLVVASWLKILYIRTGTRYPINIQILSPLICCITCTISVYFPPSA